MVSERNRRYAFSKSGTLNQFDVSEMSIGRMIVRMNRHPDIDVG